MKHLLMDHQQLVILRSILTITSVRHSDAGSYVCTMRSGSLLVVSNTAILAAVAMICMYVYIAM